MPSSLIFAGLAAAWLVVLVPMVAKRRQEVLRTTDTALASRVLHRPVPVHGRTDHGEERAMTTERITDPEPDDQPRERPFRSGRGGYDPEAAELAARAKYAFRQRVVIGLLVAAVGSVALALAVTSSMWWATLASVLALVGYLGYLRQQVRIEEEVRRRRSARLAAPRHRPEPAEYDDELPEQADAELDADEPEVPAVPPREVHPRAVAVDLDDEDPAFDELAPAYEPHYRRAVGE